MFTALLVKTKYLVEAIVTVPSINPLFPIPRFDQVLTFMVRTFFIIAGLAALLYLLLGAFSWITSGGNKENVDKARDKIQAAVIGLVLMLVVLSIVMLLENLLNIGLGIGKPIEFIKIAPSP